MCGGLNIWNTGRARQQEARSALASVKLEWIEDFRREVAKLTTVLRDIATGKLDDREQDFSEAEALAHRITLSINKDKHATFVQKQTQATSYALSIQYQSEKGETELQKCAELTEAMLAEAYLIVQQERKLVEQLILGKKK